MIFGLFILFVALAISLVSAYFSIIGLTAIFAASFLPIVIMGTTLEVGKIATTVWLHKHWDQSDWKIKLYLVPAVLLLMGITSMGTFGYLSKAHLDQAVPSADIQAQVQIYDDKITTQKDNIESARKALKQMDEQVDQLMARSSNSQGAKDAVFIRRGQAKERQRLTDEIDQSQKEITRLQEERAPIASKYRQAEAEVGPVKYIAALIYGDNPDANLLEKAVRWVILVIVSVFDPLAIVLILAATKSLKWNKKKTDPVVQEPIDLTGFEIFPEQPVEEPFEPILETHDPTEADAILLQDEPTVGKDALASFAEAVPATVDPNSLIDFSGVDKLYDELETRIAELQNQNEVLREVERIRNDELTQLSEEMGTAVSDANKEVSSLRERLLESKRETETAALNATLARNELEELKSELDIIDTDFQKLLEQNRKVIERNHELQREVNDLISKIPQKAEPKEEVQVPDLMPIADHPLPEGTFGIDFPPNPNKGDTFLNVSYRPSRLFKWTGANWLQIDKNTSSSYAYNEQYIEYLIEKLAKQEYTLDDLSDPEREQIQDYLSKHGD